MWLVDSVKGPERIRRGNSTKLLLKGSETCIPLNWKQFLLNDDNKKQLIQFVLKEWSSPKYAKKLEHRRIFFAAEHECFLLTSSDGKTTSKTIVSELCSSQEEADTRLLLHVHHANMEWENGGLQNIIVRSPDTDVFLLLLYFRQTNF